MKKRILQLIIALLIALPGTMAQTVTMPAMTVNPGQVLVPVNMTGFSNVAAITLEIEYDAQVLSFVGIQNQALTGNWYANYNGSKLIITYQATPFGTGYPMNGQLLNINFNYLGGFATPLTFGNGCSIANQFLQTYPSVTYVNGSITPLAGTGTVTLSQETASATSDVALDVTMDGSGFSDVKALTFKIGYDDSKLVFTQVINSVLGGTLTASATSGVVTITWTGTSQNLSAPTNVFDVKFVYSGGGTTPVTFEPGCQVSNSSLALIPVTYVDGEVQEETGTTTLDIADVIGTQGNVETVPLTLGAIAGGGYLGAMTLKIAYDNTKLTYTGFTYGTITSGISATALNGVVTVTWAKSNNTTDLTGVIMSLKFLYNTNLTVPITFGPGCVLTRTNLSNITMDYSDGSIMTCNPVITSQPVDAAIAYGANAGFTVVATNPCYYQWQIQTTPSGPWVNLSDDAVYSGTTTGTLTVTTPGLLFVDYSYRCELGPTVTSDEVAITFLNPVITLQPVDATVSVGGNTSFSLTATGVANYLWYFSSNGGANWLPLTGENSNTLNLTGVTASMDGYMYRCELQPNSFLSDEVTLTVTYSISGVLKYANTSGGVRPITNSTVYLKTSDGLTVLASTVSDGSGNFTFSDVTAGSYKLDASTSKAWGGLTLADYAIVRSFVNTGTPVLTGIFWTAADVNMSSTITLADYAIIRNRVNTGSTAGWTAPDWFFQILDVTVTNANVINADVIGICSGDVNASYVPAL